MCKKCPERSEDEQLGTGSQVGNCDRDGRAGPLRDAEKIEEAVHDSLAMRLMRGTAWTWCAAGPRSGRARGADAGHLKDAVLPSRRYDVGKVLEADVKNFDSVQTNFGIYMAERRCYE